HDGKMLLYEISEGDRCLGGHEATPGLYWMDLRGRESHRIAPPGDAPLFSLDDKRAYYTLGTYTEHDLITTLESVDLTGNDRRIHAKTRDADTSELRMSPDLHWLAFRDRQQYYVTRYRETGATLLVDTSGAVAP